MIIPAGKKVELKMCGPSEFAGNSHYGSIAVIPAWMPESSA